MDTQTILVTLHVVGFAVGLGSATSFDIVFLRAIRNGIVSKDEYNILKSLSAIVWAGVLIIIVTGALLLALQRYETGDILRVEWSFFQLKMVAFTVLVVNGILFRLLAFPIIKTSIGKSFRTQTMKRSYLLFAISGAVSIISWYVAFFMVALKDFFINYNFTVLLFLYLIAVALASIGAYVAIHLYGEGKGALVDEAKKWLMRILLLFALFAVVVSTYIIFL